MVTPLTPHLKYPGSASLPLQSRAPERAPEDIALPRAGAEVQNQRRTGSRVLREALLKL